MQIIDESSRGRSENTLQTDEPSDEVPADTAWEARSRSQALRKVTIEPEKKVVFRRFYIRLLKYGKQ